MADVRDLAAELGVRCQGGPSRLTAAEWIDDGITRLNQARFHLAVIGEFSVGKSFFVNSLLRQVRWHSEDGELWVQGLLPDDILPTTSCVTVVEYGETVSAVRVGRDGMREAMSLEDFRRRVTVGHHAEEWRKQAERRSGIERRAEEQAQKEGTDPAEIGRYVQEAMESEVADQWEEVHITCPSDYLADGITIVDTPGLGSVYPFHRMQTLHFASSSDAVIFLVGTNPPVRESELRAMEQVLLLVQDEVFFVQTMKDQNDRVEHGRLIWEKGLEYNQSKITGLVRQVTGDGAADAAVYPVSSLWEAQAQLQSDTGRAEKGGFPPLRKRLESYLARQRGAPLISRPLQRARRVGGQIDATLARRLQAMQLQLGLDQLREQMAVLEPRLHSLGESGDRAVGTLKGQFEDLRQECQSRISRLIQDLSNRILVQMPETLSKMVWGKISRQDARSVGDRFQDDCTTAVTRWSIEELQPLVARRVQRATREANRAMTAEIRKLELAIDWDDLSLDTIGSEVLGAIDQQVVGIDDQAMFAGVGTLIAGTVIGALAHHAAWGAIFGAVGAFIAVALAAILLPKVAISRLRPKVETALSDLRESLDAQVAEIVTRIEEELANGLTEQVRSATGTIRAEYQALLDQHTSGQMDFAREEKLVQHQRDRLAQLMKSIDGLQQELANAGGVSA
jgi:hypothetical protein